MWKVKVINWVTNIFGTVAGVPQLIEGFVYFQQGDIGHGISSIAAGVGILAIGYFTGKSAMSVDGSSTAPKP